ncbi:MAG TPA: sulfatase-like hydrolase/transferase [Vicinamibacteria bacterium]
MAARRRRAWPFAFAAVLLAAGLGWWWFRRPAGGFPQRARRLWSARGVDRPNVLLVTLDTTRADRLGCYGYPTARTPNLDALAGRGVLFTQAASTSPLTQPAHSSIMTGMYPTHHGVRVNGQTALSREQTTLAEALAERGYATGAFLGAFVLDGRWGLDQGFQVYDDRFDLEKHKHLDLGSVQRPADQVVDAALRWLETRRAGPFLAWVHLYDPHTPYEPPEPLRSEYGPRGMAALYDGEIAFTDQQVGRLVSWLQSRGLQDRTAIVVIGDHGEALGQHGEGTHGYFVYDETQRVPFLVTTPFAELQGVRVDAQVSAVDVFPTVLALAGIEDAAEGHGRSLLPAMFEPGRAETADAYGESMAPNLQFGWSALHFLRAGRYKVIKAPRPELYDLASDPAETANVYESQRAVARDLLARLDELMERTARGAPAPEAANLDEETLERLSALGYVGTSSRPRASDPPRPLADPKDKLAIFAAVQQAGELIVKDDYRGAATALEAALRDEPGMPQALLMLGTSYAELGRPAQAKAQFDRVLKDDPQNVQGLVGMASLLMEEGRAEEVIALGKRTLSLDDRNAQAHTLLGEAYASLRRPAEAVPFFEKAVEIQPKLTRNRLNLAGSLIEVEQYARAEALLKEIVAEHPRFPLAQFNLGLVYDELGRHPEARAAYAAEVAAYPRQFKARFNLGKVLFQLGDRPGALAQMREVVRLAPRQAEGYLFLARGLLQEQAPIEEVERLVEKGLSLAQERELKALGWLLMADVYNRKRQPENMNDALRRARAYVSDAEGRPPAARSH